VPHELYNIQITGGDTGTCYSRPSYSCSLSCRWERVARSARRALGAVLVAIVASILGVSVGQEWRVRSEYVPAIVRSGPAKVFAD